MKKTALVVNDPHYRDRGHPRCDLRLSTKMELEDGREIAIRVSNISQSGIGAHSIEQTPIGSDVEVTLPKIGMVPARVVWQIGTAIGARLASELTVNQILGLALDTMREAEQEDGSPKN